LSNWRLSKRYAKALFSLGREGDSFNKYGRELEKFTAFYRENAEFRKAITNPVFSIEDRRTLLQAVLNRSDFSVLIRNFLRLLLDKNRIGAIEAITTHHSKLIDETSNIAHAEIVTARPLKQRTLDNVVKSLEGLTSKKIKPHLRENPEIIGGVIVKIGDTIFDGSVRAQIEGLKESFKRSYQG
jgi:F-type H+-transporting ATPase subunit delta